MRRSTPSLFLPLLLLTACYGMRHSHGGGQTHADATRSTNPADIALPDGYRIEVVAGGLTFPSGITFDDKGTAHVTEAGYAYGETWLQPKLLRLEPGSGGVMVGVPIATGEKNGPWTGVDWHDGNFYVAEGGQGEGGKILKISPQGKTTVLLSNLPSMGDHHTDGPAIHGGYVYFGQGTVTNSGVVGEDNLDFGWLKRHPDYHDIPCRDVTLAGQNFTTDNPLTEAKSDKATTGAYVAFGQSTQPGQVIKGQIPCSGAILRLPLAGGEPELVAWGLRNPFGLAFSTDGALYVTDNAYDERGSRPVWGSGDVLWKIENGQWYGWPDFVEGRPIEQSHVPGKKDPAPLLQKHPGAPPQPVAKLGVHSSACALDFSRNAAFGHQGEAFIALFGDMAPGVGKVLKPVGFKVVRVDTKTGIVHDFAANRGKVNGPATWLKKAGLERPVAARFNPAGDALYVVDFGIMKTDKHGPTALPKTGVIWKITKTAGKQ